MFSPGKSSHAAATLDLLLDPSNADAGFRRCGKTVHMYEHTEHGGTAPLTRDEDCLIDRHRAAYGAAGLPHTPLDAAPRGHLEPLGRQGQPRRPVVAVDGCDDERLWSHAFRSQPLLLRGCVTNSSPAALAWTPSHLRRMAAEARHAAGHEASHQAPPAAGAAAPADAAPNERAGGCDERLDAYIDRMSASAPDAPLAPWSCAHLPLRMLADVAVPFPLSRRPFRVPAGEAHGNVSLWYGRDAQTELRSHRAGSYVHQIDGSGLYLLLDPADSPLLYADHAETDGATPLEPLAVDLDAFPLAAHATIWPVTLRRGDLLFLPAHWWRLHIAVPAQDAARPAHARHVALVADVEAGVEALPAHADSRRWAEMYLNLPETVPAPADFSSEPDPAPRAPRSLAELCGSRDGSDGAEAPKEDLTQP